MDINKIFMKNLYISLLLAPLLFSVVSSVSAAPLVKTKTFLIKNNLHAYALVGGRRGLTRSVTPVKNVQVISEKKAKSDSSSTASRIVVSPVISKVVNNSQPVKAEKKQNTLIAEVTPKTPENPAPDAIETVGSIHLGQGSGESASTVDNAKNLIVEEVAPGREIFVKHLDDQGRVSGFYRDLGQAFIWDEGAAVDVLGTNLIGEIVTNNKEQVLYYGTERVGDGSMYLIVFENGVKKRVRKISGNALNITIISFDDSGQVEGTVLAGCSRGPDGSDCSYDFTWKPNGQFKTKSRTSVGDFVLKTRNASGISLQNKRISDSRNLKVSGPLHAGIIKNGVGFDLNLLLPSSLADVELYEALEINEKNQILCSGVHNTATGLSYFIVTLPDNLPPDGFFVNPSKIVVGSKNDPNVFVIKWRNFDPEDASVVSLYYNRDPGTSNGKLIVKDIQVPKGKNYFSYEWDLSKVVDDYTIPRRRDPVTGAFLSNAEHPYGFSVYGVINDEINQPRVFLSDAPALFNVDGEGQYYRITREYFSAMDEYNNSVGF